MKTLPATVEQIEALQSEAARASDTKTFNACSRALDGSERALKLVGKLIVGARHEAMIAELGGRRP